MNADNPALLIFKGNTFTDNLAKKAEPTIEFEGNGGCIFFTCSTEYKCVSVIHGNTFHRNKAEVTGGVVKWDDIEPTFTENKFENNSAIMYGDDIAGVV